jgi:hypothetical protein
MGTGRETRYPMRLYALFLPMAMILVLGTISAPAQQSTPEKQQRKALVAEMKRELKAKSCKLADQLEIPFNPVKICPAILPQDTLEASRWKMACWLDVEADFNVLVEWNQWVLKCLTRKVQKVR